MAKLVSMDKNKENRHGTNQTLQLKEENKYKRKSNLMQENKQELNYLHLLIYFLIGILPLVVRLKIYDPKMQEYNWFTGQTSYADFFLYYKQKLLIITGAVMLIIAVTQTINRRKLIVVKEFFVFIPLAFYGILALLSSIFSKYTYFAFHGSMDQFESVFTLLSYSVIVYYTYININTQQEVQRIFRILVFSALIMGIIGIFQFAGYDFFRSELGFKLIVPEEYRSSYALQATFESNRVYMSLFNPNYVGVYIALVTPMILILAFFQKGKRWSILSFLTVVALLICEFGSQSAAGLVGLCVAFLMILIFFRHYIFKNAAITVPVFLLLLIGLIVLNGISDNRISNKVKATLQFKKTEHAVTDLETSNDGISLTYKGNLLKIKSSFNENGALSLQVIDQNQNLVAMSYDAASNIYTMEDAQLSDMVLGVDLSQPGVFYLQAEGFKYRFTNLTEDGTYYYINAYNRLDKLKTASSIGFKGYESIASGRGYIWSRTIPLLKDYVLIGSGADTFAMVFPQNDYMNMSRYGYSGQIMSKPHNLFLQIGVQTGVLSLIAFLIFYGVYFITSIRLYILGKFISYYEKVGVAIFLGTVSYMITGLTNDSSIGVAPIFWAFMGIGIAINNKVKILRE